MSTPQIQTTIAALVDAEPALGRLASQKLDARTRYHVVKLTTLVTAEVQAHFYAPRHEAFKEFGVPREPTAAERAKMGPDPVLEVAPANLDKFRARMKDLGAVPVTIPWGPITSAMVEAYVDLTAADLLALGPLFVLSEPPVEATPAT